MQWKNTRQLRKYGSVSRATSGSGSQRSEIDQPDVLRLGWARPRGGGEPPLPLCKMVLGTRRSWDLAWEQVCLKMLEEIKEHEIQNPMVLDRMVLGSSFWRWSWPSIGLSSMMFVAVFSKSFWGTAFGTDVAEVLDMWQTKFLQISEVTHQLYRRKFRSQTSDNMDRWKAEQGRGREKRKIRREKIRRERARRQKMQMREKVGKSRNTVFFQWFGAPEGRKVGSLKRRVRSQLAIWEMKICTPLWREAHFEVKMYKTHHGRTTFGSCNVEKVHAVVARSTFGSQNVKNTRVRTTFGSWDVEKVHAVVARSTFWSQKC